MIRSAIALGVMAVVLAFLSGVALPQNFPNCVEFGFNISHGCCCTANCCAEAKEGEFKHVGNDDYQSTVTGQIIKRTGWSPDGRFIRCACDQIDGVWTWHERAFVRCVYPPLPSS